MSNEQLTREVTEKIVALIQTAPAGGVFHDATTDDIIETDDGNRGFEVTCDDYSAFAFNIYTRGRQYHVRVEDVTIT